MKKKKNNFFYVPIEPDALIVLIDLHEQTNIPMIDLMNIYTNVLSAYFKNEEIQNMINAWLSEDEEDDDEEE